MRKTTDNNFFTLRDEMKIMIYSLNCVRKTGTITNMPVLQCASLQGKLKEEDSPYPRLTELSDECSDLCRLTLAAGVHFFSRPGSLVSAIKSLRVCLAGGMDACATI